MKTRIAAVVLATSATIAIGATSANAETVHLTKHQKHNVVKIVRHLSKCGASDVTNCKVRSHGKTLASFEADGHSYYVVIRGGKVVRTEVY